MSELTRRTLLALHYALFAFGAAALAYCAFVFTEAKVTQWYDSWKLDRAARQPASVPAPVASKTPEAAPRPATPPARGESIGRIEIPRVDVKAMIREGEDSRTLAKAVGHIPGTALPGTQGNAVLAAHRDTFFRGLRNIRKDDLIQIKTVEGEHQYKVVSTEVVDPTHIEVLRPTPDPMLTLITCYPFNFIGNAPKRFIVRAEKVEAAETAAAATEPAAAQTLVPALNHPASARSSRPAVKSQLAARRGSSGAKQARAKPRAPKAPPVETAAQDEAASETKDEPGARGRGGIRGALSFVPRLGRRILGR